LECFGGFNQGESNTQPRACRFAGEFSSIGSIVYLKTLEKRDNQATQILIASTKEQFEKILQQGLLFDASCTAFERIMPLTYRFVLSSSKPILKNIKYLPILTYVILPRPIAL
jgi:hypothetical protein